MEKQTLFRDRQELQSADLNAIQTYTADSLQHLRQDAITDDLAFTGGLVAAASATEITVSTLRFYNDGKVYVAEDAQTLNLFQYLPLVAKKVVAVVVWGQQTDTHVEPRDFLIDLTTGATQPQAVAMQQLNAAQVNLLPGAESADPQPPVIQTGTLAIAYVYLTPTGIERIEMQDAVRLPNLGDTAQRVTTLETWKAQAEPRISSIATDLSALANKTTGLASRATMIEMAGDIGRLKAALNLPATYASYESDAFIDADLTDPGVAGYAARIKNGLCFPYAGEATAPLALFNPYDANISRSADGLVLPAFTSTARIQTKGYAGDLSISQYQVQALTATQYTTAKQVQRYGKNANSCPSYYRRHLTSLAEAVALAESIGGSTNSTYSPLGGYRWDVLNPSYVVEEVAEQSYVTEYSTTHYNGVILGQTVLVANATWATKLGLNFTQLGGAGDVHVLLCETVSGKPDLGKVLSGVTVPVASLKKYPTETAIDIPPVLLSAGTRYAIVIITQGDHRVAVVSGNDYTQGTLFYGSDGDYFSGDLTKDLMFTLYGAQFSQPRTEVVLQSVSLAGGISDMEIAADMVIPSGTELTYEIQVGGRWYPFGDPVFRLADMPDIVPLRAVLLGTSDLQPALKLAADVITASRPTTTFTHYSTERTLISPAPDIQVQVVVSPWDAANHTLACTLLHDGAEITPSVSSIKSEPEGDAQRITYTFIPAAPINTYRIKLSGSRTAGANPFAVIERTDIAS